MGLKVITPPAIISVVSDADLRTHLRIAADGTENGLMAAYRAAAHQAAEHYTGAAIGSQTLELALDAFPDEIPLPRGKVTSITSITYKDTAGAPQTLSESQYVLDDYSPVCRIVPADGVSWPSTQALPNAVKVRYVAGDVPPAARAAILLTVGHLFENREAVAPGTLAEVPMGARHLLDTIRVYGA